MKTWSIVAANPEDLRSETTAVSREEVLQAVRKALDRDDTLITITRES